MWQKKACLIGDFFVGKTSLVRRFVEGRFDERYLSTIGVKVNRKQIQLGKPLDTVQLNLLLWDIAGGNGRETIAAQYLRGSAGAVVVCDLSRRETLEGMRWHAQSFLEINPTGAMVFIGNKADLVETREVTTTQLAALASEFSCPYFEASAKTGQSVEEFFMQLGSMVLREENVGA